MHKTLFFCLPKYKPDLGHEDIAAHSKSRNGHFYALVGKEWAGVVSSMYVFALHKVSVLALILSQGDARCAPQGLPGLSNL
jgi:hypothetical protein